MTTVPNGHDHDVEAAEETAALAELMQHYLPDALLIVREGTVMWASPAIEDVIGLAPGAVVDAPLSDLVHPDDRDALAGACEAAGRGDGESLAVRMRGAGDMQVPATAWVQARVEGDGVVVAVRPAVGGTKAHGDWDLTTLAARKLAERAGDVLWVLDGNGATIEVSAAIHDLLSWTPEEAAAIGGPKLVHPDDYAMLRTYRSAVQADTARGSIEIRVRARGGGYRWVRGTGVMVRDGAGKPEDTRVIVAWRDIDALVRDTRFAERESERLRDILDAALDPWLMLSPVRNARGAIVDFVVQDANAGAAEYLRWPRDRLIGISLLEEFPSVASHGLMPAYIEAMQSGELVVIHDLVYPHELFGKERRYEARAQASGGSLMVTWRDTTPASRARNELAANEIFFRALASSAGDALVALDAGTVRWASPGAIAMGLTSGCDFEDVMGHLVVPDSIPQVRACSMLLEGGHDYAGRWHRFDDGVLVVSGHVLMGNGERSVVAMIAENWTATTPAHRDAAA